MLRKIIRSVWQAVPSEWKPFLRQVVPTRLRAAPIPAASVPASDCEPGLRDLNTKATTAQHGVLILAEIFNDQKPQFVQTFFGDDAYELVTISGYMRELLDVRNTEYLCSTPGFRYLYPVMSFLAQHNENLRFEEIGSTLFSTIDKLRKSERQLGRLSFASISFVGVEISDLLIDTAVALHPDENIYHFKKVDQIPLEPTLAVGRSYQATSYAFSSTEEFAEWLARFRFSVHGAWFSVSGPEQKIKILSNIATLFDFDRLVGLLQQRGHRLHLISSQRYRLTSNSYILSWFLVENFVDTERVELLEFLKKFDHFLTHKVDLLRPMTPGGERGPISDAGPHCGAIFPEGGPYDLRFPNTFDFGSPDIEKRFEEYLKRIDK